MIEGLKKISEEVKNTFAGIEILNVKLSKIRGDYYIKIELDDLNNQYGSVSISTCEAFSKSFIENLDQKILQNNIEYQLPIDLTLENYTLEVSSAGAEREIKFPEELERFKKSPLKIIYKENDKKKTKILNFLEKKNEGEYLFKEYKTKKDKTNQSNEKYVVLKIEDVIKANLYLDF